METAARSRNFRNSHPSSQAWDGEGGPRGRLRVHRERVAGARGQAGEGAGTPQMTVEQRPGHTSAQQVREDAPGPVAGGQTRTERRTMKQEGGEGGRKDQSQQHRNPPEEFSILFLLKTKEK